MSALAARPFATTRADRLDRVREHPTSGDATARLVRDLRRIGAHPLAPAAQAGDVWNLPGVRAQNPAPAQNLTPAQANGRAATI